MRITEVLVAARAPFLSATMVNVLFLTCYSGANGYVPDFFQALFVFLGTAFLHLGANTLNDFSDWDRSDRINLNASPFNGGSRNTPGLKLEKHHFAYFSLVFFSMAVVSGIIVIFAYRRPLVIVPGVLGLLAGIFYSFWGNGLQSKGIGEFIIFMGFGPLLGLGVMYVYTGELSFQWLILGIPGGMTVVIILLVNEIPDYESDLLSGKKNIAVLLGRKYIPFIAAACMLTASFFQIYIWFAGSMNKWAGIISIGSLVFGLFLLLKIYKKVIKNKKITALQGGVILWQFLTMSVGSIAFFI
ncbi:MAG: prenyltransferase [Deltaproteobacteria bacterium]|nr:prenyltransferase [Deltaproteobacteria bacterium]